MISLAGKAALITGGSRGIGAAAVKLFAQAGADVVFNYAKAKDAALQVQQEAGKHGTRVEAFKADVGKHAENQSPGSDGWTFSLPTLASGISKISPSKRCPKNSGTT